jgi:hypothetical protein
MIEVRGPRGGLPTHTGHPLQPASSVDRATAGEHRGVPETGPSEQGTDRGRILVMANPVYSTVPGGTCRPHGGCQQLPRINRPTFVQVHMTLSEELVGNVLSWSCFTAEHCTHILIDSLSTRVSSILQGNLTHGTSPLLDHTKCGLARHFFR